MRNFLRSMLTRAGKAFIPFVAGLGIGSLVIGPAALALVLPPNFAQRQFPSQQVHYLRATLAFPFCVQSGTGCTVKIGAMPYNSIVLRVAFVTYVAFNSTTSDTLTLGTTQANANEIVSSAASIHAIANVSGTVVATVFNSMGGGATQTGGDGGFDIWAKWAPGAINTASAGITSVVIEYIAPNDGGCVYTPMTATNPGC
jgi:hypothetical protein